MTKAGEVPKPPQQYSGDMTARPYKQFTRRRQCGALCTVRARMCAPLLRVLSPHPRAPARDNGVLFAPMARQGRDAIRPLLWGGGAGMQAPGSSTAVLLRRAGRRGIDGSLACPLCHCVEPRLSICDTTAMAYFSAPTVLSTIEWSIRIRVERKRCRNNSYI